LDKDKGGTSSFHKIVRLSAHSKDATNGPFITFCHPELFLEVESAPKITSTELINKLNFINLTNSSIFLHLQHARYKKDFVVTAFPDACQGNTVSCSLSKKDMGFLKEHVFLDVIIPNGNEVIISPATIQHFNENTILLQLPEESYTVNHRQVMRYRCKGIVTDLHQNAFHAKGQLIDFSPMGFCIKLLGDSFSSINWFNTEVPVTATICKGEKVLFSSACRCIRQKNSKSISYMVLAPLAEEMHQFKKKKLRNLRQRPVTPFIVYFDHPLLGKKFLREICDITTTGFSVIEDAKYAVLLAGMIIPSLTIKYAGVFEMSNITVQVVYRKTLDDDSVRCGLAILDMNIKTYSSLNTILTTTLDPHTFNANEVDLDELWNLFFETGFIYPEKYRDIHTHRKEFKRTYNKLYGEDPEIARHFIYQKGGRIYGHISLIRSYEKTWMFHHLAAKALQKTSSGIVLLKQINHFINELYRMPSAKMEYLMFYFRPENRFSRLMFGEFADSLNQPRICSTDLFSYLQCAKADSPETTLPEGWAIRSFSSEDLWELTQFYNQSSGGLAIDALNLNQRNHPEGETIEKVYERLGFTRKIEIFSIHNKGVLTAVMIVNQTDVGFNLSNLLNCVKVFVCNPEHLPGPTLATAIQTVLRQYKIDPVPVLVYPSGYIDENKCFDEKKKYVMCVMDAKYVSEFMEFTKKKYKINFWV